MKINLNPILFFTLFIFFCSGAKYKPTLEVQQIRNNFAALNLPYKKMLLENTKYQTPVYLFDSNKKGLALLILGGTHGDEPAGYESAFRLLNRFYQDPPQSGKIILIPEANRLAVENFNRRVPVPEGVDIEKGNLNRCYPGKEDGFPMERMAYQIQKLAIENSVQAFIDLHEARRPHLNSDPERETKGLGQTIIYYPNEESTILVINMLDGINANLQDPSAKFSSLERPIKNSAAWWAGETLGIAAFTSETSRSFPLEERIAYHLKLVEIVLQSMEML
jgi:succinylglutamate desuccinylase